MFTDQMYVSAALGIAWGLILLGSYAISSRTQHLNEVLFKPMSFPMTPVNAVYFFELCKCKVSDFRSFKFRLLEANKNYDLFPTERRVYPNGKEGTSC